MTTSLLTSFDDIESWFWGDIQRRIMIFLASVSIFLLRFFHYLVFLNGIRHRISFIILEITIKLSGSLQKPFEIYSLVIVYPSCSSFSCSSYSSFFPFFFQNDDVDMHILFDVPAIHLHFKGFLNDEEIIKLFHGALYMMSGTSLCGIVYLLLVLSLSGWQYDIAMIAVPYICLKRSQSLPCLVLDW